MSAPLFFHGARRADKPSRVQPAVEVDGWCFVTGQMPTFREDDSKPRRRYRRQTVRVMENLKIVLDGLKLGLEHEVFARATHDFEANYRA